MKRVVPFHPPLVAAFPVLSVFSSHMSLVPVAQLWRPLGIAVGAAMFVWLVAGLVLRSAERGALATTALLGSGFFFSPIAGVVGLGGFAVALWGALAIGAIVLAVRAKRLTPVLNVLALMLFAVTAGRATLSVVQGAKAAAAQTSAGQAKAGERPDIFYLVVDGYGRSDALRRSLGYDNSEFVAALEERGFILPERSVANYCQTELSLASSLNMTTIPELLPDMPKDSFQRLPLAGLIEDNRVVREARRLGYSVVFVGTGFPAVKLRDPDLWIEGRVGLTLLETALLDLTPFAVSPELGISMYNVRRELLNYAFDSLESIAGRTSKPRLVIAHLLAPHPPFVFNADGSPRPKAKGFGYFDGSDYLEFSGDAASYREGYAAQAEYLNRRLLRIIDRVLASPGPRPVVILQGDHGSKLHLNQNSLEKTDVTEAFPILNALYLPDAVRAKLPADTTPVNTFRVLYSTLFGLDLPPLPNRSWYSEYGKPYDLVEVTERLQP